MACPGEAQTEPRLPEMDAGAPRLIAAFIEASPLLVELGATQLRQAAIWSEKHRRAE